MLFVFVFNVVILAFHLLGLPRQVANEHRKPDGWPMLVATIATLEIIGFVICAGLLWRQIWP